MNISQVTPVDHIMLEPGGRIILPETVMTKFVVETPGGTLWFNKKDMALGIRLLRGNDRPPYLIERMVDGQGRLTGLLDAGPFLTKVCSDRKFGEPRVLPIFYFAQYHMLSIPLTGQTESEPARPLRVLDDFPALED
jgi:hypothetical protein